MNLDSKSNKFILDACCGNKMFWFQKDHPNVLYNDLRQIDEILCDGRKLKINPEERFDFRKIPYSNNRFKLIIFDPPHFKSLGKTSWMAKKYGVLNKKTWQEDLSIGFKECWRVLDDYGVLIFKWNEMQVKTKDILELLPIEPLFGNKQGTKLKTIWLCFMKIPE